MEFSVQDVVLIVVVVVVGGAEEFNFSHKAERRTNCS